MSLEVYRAHQRTMRAFLDSQKQVISRLLSLETGTKSQGQRPPNPSLPGTAIPASVPQLSGYEAAGSPMGRFIVRAKPFPNVRDKSHLDGVFLVVSDSADISRSLDSRLIEYGARSAVLPSSSLCNPASAHAAVGEIRAQLGPIAGIAFAQGIRQREMPSSLAEWRIANQFEAKALFFLLQASVKDLQEHKGHVLALSAMGGGFGRHGVGWHWLPTSGAAVGLIKTAAIEWPDVSFRAVDFENPEPDFLAQVVIDELLSRDGKAREIGYLKRIRHIFEQGSAPLPLSPAPQTQWQIEPDWVFLVTGGARGITAEVLDGILLPGMTIHIVGRAAEPDAEPNWSQEAGTAGELRKKIIELAQIGGRAMTPAVVEKEISAVLRDREIRKNLKGFREKGARVIYHSADVRDEVAMEEIIRFVYEEHGRIDAVIHGAGIIEDKLLIDKSADSFQRVFDTKADSTYLLSRFLRPDSLKCLVFFASVAGRTGNRGQCDYAAANELVNRFAWWLHHRWAHVRISSINWGPWETGMASAEVNRQFRERGVIPIPRAEGRTFFRKEILFAPSDEVETIAGFFESRGRETPASLRWPLLQNAAVRHNGHEALFESALSVKSHPFLNDHRIDEKVVVPSVVAIELMAETVQSGWPEWHIIEVQNHHQLRGMILEAGNDLEIRVTARLQKSGTTVLVETTIASVEYKPKPFYQAAFLLSKEQSPLAPAPPLDVTAPAHITSEVFYTQHTFQGPSFRLIQTITGLDRTGVDATILPAGQGWNWQTSPWIFHPGVLDAAFQLGTFWPQPMLKGLALPVRLARIARYGSYQIGDEELFVSNRIRSATEHTILLDFFVVDKQRRILFRAEGVEMAHSKALLRLASQGPPL
jgi:NAD(P)-dependent dehydrogenase (short-subunit alcohol dehydrogenase family)